MSIIKKYWIVICLFVLLCACPQAKLYAQHTPDTIPYSGHRDIYQTMGSIVPMISQDGYCLTNHDGSITIHPASGCRVNLKGSYIISDFYYNAFAIYNDYITIYNGASTSCPVLKRATGSGYIDVTSDGPMTIRFESNSLFQYLPFTLQYTTVAGCACENDYPFEFSWANDTLNVGWISSIDPQFSHYSIEYGLAGFLPGEGTLAQGLNTNHCAISHLHEGSRYDFRLTYHGNGSTATVTDTYLVPFNENCIDMRNLQNSNITCTNGGYSSLTTPYDHTLTPNEVSVSRQHSVISQHTYDPFTNNGLPTIPEGVPYSIKLGNNSPAESESISYTFHVDTNSANIILLKYAAIMEQPGHNESNQPLFDLQILDGSGHIIDSTCGKAQFIANDSLGWNNFQYRTAANIVNGYQPQYTTHHVLWKDWTDVGLNVAQYHGQDITIRLTTRDCGHGEHFGYGYFHLGCLKQNLSLERCGDTDTNTFTAPTGFRYNWYYEDNPDSLIGQEQSITLPLDTTRSLTCFVESIENSSCGFWLHGDLRPVSPESDFDIERNGCTREYQFINNSYISNGTGNPFSLVCDNATWDFGDGTYSTQQNPTHTYTQPGTYTISLVSFMNQGECSDTLTKTIVVPVDSTEFSILECDSYTWNGQTYTTSGDYVQTFPRPAIGCDSLVTLHLTLMSSSTGVDNIVACDSLIWINGITYHQSVNGIEHHLLNAAGCDSTVTLNLTVNHAYDTTAILHICRSELPITYKGKEFPANATSGRYLIIDTTENGCDSIIRIELFVHEEVHEHEYLTLEDRHLPFYYQAQDTTFLRGTHSGSHFFRFQTVNGCDSIIELHLTIELVGEIYGDTNTICNGYNTNPISCDGYAYVNVRGGMPPYSYQWDDPMHQTTDTAFHLCEGDYQVRVTDSLGRSIFLNYHVSNIAPDTAVVMDTIGSSQLPYHYHGYTFQQPVNNDLLTLQNGNGCDSIVLYSLALLENSYSTFDTTVCAESFPILFHNKTFERAGTQIDSLILEDLTYNIRTFNIDTFPSNIVTIRDTICGSKLWNGLHCDTNGTYVAHLTAENGCDSTVILLLTIEEFTNPISHIIIPDFCAGEIGTITIGRDFEDNIYFTDESDASITVSETVFLPDGVVCNNMGCSYQSPIHFRNFPSNSIIQSINDIQYIRLNLEHSYAGDLYINITCPNGQRADILKFGGSQSGSTDFYSSCMANIDASHKEWQTGNNAEKSTDFGIANTNDNSAYECNPNLNAPGTGLNYCWSNNTISGYSYGNTISANDDYIYRSANVQGTRFKASDLVNKTHFYKPDQSFQNLVGCPINGDWVIEIIDGSRLDNGYLFDWELALSPDLLNISSHLIDSTTLTGPWINRDNDSTYTLSVPGYLTNDTLVDYLVSVFSEECRFDTIIQILMKAPHFAEIHDTICRTDLPYNLIGLPVFDTLHTATFPIASNGCDSIITLHLTLTDTTSSYVSDTIGIQDLAHYTFQGCSFQHAVFDTVIIINNHVNCDSLIHFSLYLYPNTTDSVDTTVCPESLPIIWRGHTFQSLTDSFVDTSYNAQGSYHLTRCFIKTYPQIHSHLNSPIPDICSVNTLYLNVGVTDTNDIHIDYGSDIGNHIVLDTISITGPGANYLGNFTYAFSIDSLHTDNTFPYHLSIINDKGCQYDTTFQIQFVPQKRTSVYDTICKEELPYITLQDTINTIGIHHISEVNYQSANGCDSIVSYNLVVLDFKNPITSINIPDICAGDTAIILVGYGGNTSISLSTEEIIHSSYQRIFLPDSIECPPYGNEYRSEQNFTEFVPHSTIRSADDILYLRMKIEHSAVEDLDIRLVCPNNSSCTILPRHITDSINSGSTTYFRVNFGVARRNIDQLDCDSTLNPIGIPWNYIWSCNTSQGYSYAGGAHHYCYENIHLSPNPIWDNEVYWLINESFKIDSSNVANMSNIYRPAEDFSNLIGCPMNGNWSIRVRDWLPNDNGYLTEWELGLSSDLYRLPEYTIEQSTLTGAWVNPLSDSTFIVTPPSTLVNDTTIAYPLTLTNVFGCHFDTIINIRYHATRYSDTTVVACEQYTWNNTTYSESGRYEFRTTSSTGCDSIARLHLTLNSNRRDTLYEYVCQGDEYEANGFHITASQTQMAGVIADSIRLTGSNGCDSIVVLNLTVATTPILTTCQDTIINAGGIVSLTVNGADFYEWSPAATLSSTTITTPTATPTQSMYYYVMGYQQLQNLVTNGDFEAGNTGFTTNYTYSSNLWNQGTYYIGTDANNYHTNFRGAHDHTTGSGRYMIINGSEIPGTTSWGQSITVEPNTNYAFSAWVTTVAEEPFARLQFKINNQQIGNIFTAPSTYQVNNVWNNFYLIWNSGNSTTATISIISQNTENNRNDFGLDDISFRKLSSCTGRDSVRVLIYRDIDTTICMNGLPITWHGVTFQDTTPQSTVIANPNGMDDAIRMHIHYFPQHETTELNTVNQNHLPVIYNGATFTTDVTDSLFILTDQNGCDSLVHYSLVVNWNTDTTIVRHICENDLPFIWRWNNIDTALYENTTMADTLQSIFATDSIVLLELFVHREYDSTIVDQVCENENYDKYGFHVTTQETRLADTLAYVQENITAFGCDSIVRLKLIVVHTNPTITSLLGDFCADSYDILSVDNIYTNYEWNTGATSPSIEIRTPGYYSITVTNGNCTAHARYNVSACDWNIYLPNAITPSNPDGQNDFFQLDERAQGLIDGENFNISIFNRFGELVFYSNDKYFRWNGEYKGKKFYNNVYIYKIKCYDNNGVYHTIKGSITIL